MKTRIIVTAAVFSLTTLAFQGCASPNYGPTLDQASVDTIIKGKTTKTELIAKYGPPAMTSSGPSGVEYLAWSSVRINISASNYIPIVGPFVGKRESQGGSLQVTLNKDKIVEDYSFSTGGYSNR